MLPSPGTSSYLGAGISDGQSERARHLAVVGQFEMGRGALANRDFLENKSVFLLKIKTLRTAERLRGELSAATADVMLFKNGGRVCHNTCERQISIG